MGTGTEQTRTLATTRSEDEDATAQFKACLDHAFEQRNRAFDRNYRRLWFDTHLHSSRSLKLLAETANPDRLVFGTNFGGWDSAQPVDVADLPADLNANARRLLRLG